jgi:transcriptional regulator with XRE-family HTH domain
MSPAETGEVRSRGTSDEYLKPIGRGLRDRRIRAALTQSSLARRSGVSTGTVGNLEAGTGGSLRSLVKVTRALGAEEWMQQLAPMAPVVDPMAILLDRERRAAQRTRRVR